MHCAATWPCVFITVIEVLGECGLEAAFLREGHLQVLVERQPLTCTVAQSAMSFINLHTSELAALEPVLTSCCFQLSLLMLHL